jgi:hypothetical protein
MATAKVIGIHGVKAPQGQASRPLPAEFTKLRDHAKERIRALMIDLFNNADDALFSMVDKSGADQATYFEAMRELRLQKKSILISTLGPALRSFSDTSSGIKGSSKKTEAEDLDTLSLVAEEDLEFDVAVEGMVQRLAAEAAEPLKAFRVRVCHMLKAKEIGDEEVPVSPEILCRGFVEGCMNLEADIKAKLIVFKLFERYVLAEMPNVYEEFNKLLASAGIMPDYKPTHKVSKSAQSGSADNSQQPEQDVSPNGARNESDGVGFDLNVLRQLLHPQGQPMTNGATSVAGMPNLKVIPHQDILNTLSLFQSNGHEAVANFITPNQSIDFQALLAARLGGSEQGKVCNDVDADVINLISMLFEFILEDRQLQAEMKAIISRLQIPLLKVALIDKTFFSKGGHPARKLLNEIASSAIGWTSPRSGRRDRYKEKLESIVEQVTDGFDDNVTMFQELLEDFNQFVDVERRRGLLVEQRTRDSEKGKAAAVEARLATQEVINKAIDGRAVPDLGMELLKDAWSNVLVFKYLREGADSQAWHEAVDVVTQLVWSLCPDPKEPEARAKLLQLIPNLVAKVRAGFQDVALDETLAKRLLDKLEDQHVLSLQALQQQVDLQETAEHLDSYKDRARVGIDESVSAQNDEVSDLVRSTLELEEDFKQLQEACEQADEKHAGIESQNEKLPKKQENIVLVEESNESEGSELAEDSPFVQQVDRFVVGCWFEFGSKNSNERCKLAAVIRSTGKHIFVNRAGVKVVEKNRMALAEDLRSGELQVLNDGLLFDRALESIITNLRS